MGFEVKGGFSGGPGSKRAPVVRPWLLIVLLLLLCGVGALLTVLFVSRIVNRVEGVHQEAAVAREQRVVAVAQVALAPLPVTEPVVQRPGKDSYGYPLAYVDQSGLRSLLGRGKYQELSAYIEHFQAQADADFHFEYFIEDAGVEAFESAEREIEPSLDAWVRATPSSFAPYLARGAHRFAVGFAMRGVEFANKTDAENFNAMEAAFALSFSDLEQALQLNPRLLPALREELRIAFVGSAHTPEFNAISARAFQICPACFAVRVSQQFGLQPRWRGSYARMAAAARLANPTLNPRFSMLPGYALLDEAATLQQNKQYAEALALADRANALGSNPDFLLERARIMEWLDDDAAALANVTRALELRPLRPDLLLFRTHVYTRPATKNPEAAYRDLVIALRLAPSEREARDSLPYVVQGLTYVGWQAHQKGDENEALRLLDEAAELAPSSDLEARRSAVLTSGFHGKPEETKALQAAADAAPHDFYAHERLDYALSLSRDWVPIGAMWTAYIAANPDDGRAYYERGGTYSNQGNAAASHADATRACELGISAGCAYARR